jgi:hypothetical protein
MANKEGITLFDAIGYFKNLCSLNRLARKTGFYPCSCSGIDSLEEVLDLFRTHSCFFAVDDTNDGVTERRSGGFFKKRTFTVFLLHRYEFGNMSDREKALSICRELYRQIHSRLLVDKERFDNNLIYMNTENVFSRELGQYFLNGCTGLYFMFDVSEPLELIFNEEEWDG